MRDTVDGGYYTLLDSLFFAKKYIIYIIRLQEKLPAKAVKNALFRFDDLFLDSVLTSITAVLYYDTFCYFGNGILNLKLCCFYWHVEGVLSDGQS